MPRRVLLSVHDKTDLDILARTLHALELDVHHAKIATFANRALDVFYVWDSSGQKLASERASEVTRALRKALLGGG